MGEQFFIPATDTRVTDAHEAHGHKMSGKIKEKAQKPPEPYALHDVCERGVADLNVVANTIAGTIMELYNTDSRRFLIEGVGAGKQFAEIQNELVKYMVHQKDRNAFGLVANAVSHALIARVQKKGGVTRGMVEAVSKTFVNQFFTPDRLRGVGGEVAYIRGRAQALGMTATGNTMREHEGGVYHRIMTEGKLDASHEIDVVEMAYTKDEQGEVSEIQELRFVQVKTSTLPPQEVARIHGVHATFARTREKYPIEAFGAHEAHEDADMYASAWFANAKETLDLCLECEVSEDECIEVLESLASLSDEDSARMASWYTRMKEYAEHHRASGDTHAWESLLQRLDTLLKNALRVAEKKRAIERMRIKVVPVRRIVSVVSHKLGCEEKDITGVTSDGSAHGIQYRAGFPRVDNM